MQLAVTFDSAWDQLTFSDQAMVDNDLSRLPSQVERHVRTVSGFRTYIEDCVAEQVGGDRGPRIIRTGTDASVLELHRVDMVTT